jgi:hypothetical protein
MDMFNQVCDNFRRATEATVQMQQEMFKTWLNLWPVAPGNPRFWGEQVQQFQKKWVDALGELLKKQREVTGEHFKAGLENLQKAFQLAEAKTPEELRTQSIELWKKCFNDLQQVYEAQLRGFQFATDKWAELTTKSAA